MCVPKRSLGTRKTGNAPGSGRVDKIKTAGESSPAVLLSSQLWLTTSGVAGAFNPERPGIRLAGQSARHGIINGRS
jgi:hypothetical protein